METAAVDEARLLASLLDQFKGIRGESSAPPTFLEAAGYPHYENVASNLLAFFLDPNEGHGLGTLFLDALLTPLGLEGLSFLRVEREVGTPNRKRLDLVVELESHVVGVENKVYAGLNNPLKDYRAHLLRRAAGREWTLLLLCLYEPSPLPPGVVVVTYEDLMGRVLRALDSLAGAVPARYVTYATDFAQTMENLRKGSRMNPAVRELFRERGKDVVGLLGAVGQLKGELREKVLLTGKLVDEERPTDLPNEVQQRPWAPSGDIFDDLVHDVRFPSGSVVAVDAWFDLGGWQVTIWQRRSVVGRLSMPELSAWLQEHEVPLLLAPGTMGGWRDRLVTADFSVDASPQEVATHVAGVVTAIARAHAAPGEQPVVGPLTATGL